MNRTTATCVEVNLCINEAALVQTVLTKMKGCTASLHMKNGAMNTKLMIFFLKHILNLATANTVTCCTLFCSKNKQASRTANQYPANMLLIMNHGNHAVAAGEKHTAKKGYLQARENKTNDYDLVFCIKCMHVTYKVYGKYVLNSLFFYHYEKCAIFKYLLWLQNSAMAVLLCAESVLYNMQMFHSVQKSKVCQCLQP